MDGRMHWKKRERRERRREQEGEGVERDKAQGVIFFKGPLTDGSSSPTHSIGFRV
jgi:hypothetical protein